jgi:AbiV family abortive infection protein
MNDLSWWDSVEAALAVGRKLTTSIEELNQACEHIVRLLQDASSLLGSGSHATAAFLAITSLEETAKVHIGMYRRSGSEIRRSKDPLYKHAEKHKIAGGPTVSMGKRLQSAIGEERTNELLEIARGGGLVPLRESALYVERNASSLSIPGEAVSPSTARELLLLAVEAFDDALVGYTNRTFELRGQTDRIFERWASAPNPSFKRTPDDAA